MSVDCHHTLSQVIKSFRHRGLRELYKDGRSARVSPGHITKIERILTALDRSDDPDGMDLPGFRLHPLKGRMKGHYAVSVSGNWRVTFRLANPVHPGAIVREGRLSKVARRGCEQDYLDYH